ncbi:MAG: hypothetical protein IJ603_06150 [Bacteroidales bacterium]|nr:hypothetical protein [Bacteroidales bacterium]
MTADELTILQNAAATIKRGEYYLNLSASLEDSPSMITRSTLAELAEKSTDELRKARPTIEAHATSGQPFPALARDLFDLLSAGSPEWLEYLSKPKAAAWAEAARAILAAAGSPSGSNENAVRNEEAEAPQYPHLNTQKSENELRRIFAALVKEGYIDGSGPEAEQSFLYAFDPAAPEQGRIKWICDKNGRGIDKAGICAFLKLTLPNNFDKWRTAAAAIFVVEIGKHERERYWNREDNLKRIEEISAIMR